MKYSMRRIILPLLLTMVLMLSACGKSSSTPAQSMPEDPPVQAEPAEPEAQPPRALSAEELRTFTELFGTPEYNGFLEKPFLRPSEIEWDAVLRNGAGITEAGAGEEEIADYLAATDQKVLYGDLFVLRKSALSDFALRHTGSGQIPEGEPVSWVYLSSRDSFYLQHWANEMMLYDCVSGEQSGDRYVLRFTLNDSSPGVDPRSHRGVFADRILTMTKSGDDYVMESNILCWDDHCDPEQTFDVNLPQFDGPVRLITYQDYNGETSIVLVKNGKRMTELSTYIQADVLAYLRKINAIGFLDFNADGMQDIALIGDSDYGTHALLYEALTTDDVFGYFADLDETKLTDLGADATIDGLKSVLLSDRSENVYGSWQDAYAQTAKAYSIADNRVLYDLIFADTDEIPELVINEPGYWTSLFTFENGYARCLMNHWPYGAGGNAGYSYYPGTGVYYNGNADYAGAIYYEYYMSKRDTGEIDTDYWVRHLNFNDLNGDGEPSEEELLASGDYTGSSEYRSEINPQMTKDEIRAAIAVYQNMEMLPLAGTMDYATLLSRLG